MKRFIKLFSLVLTVALVLGITAYAFADTSTTDSVTQSVYGTTPSVTDSVYGSNPISIKFTIGSQNYTASGQQNTMDAITYIDNGRTYVPVRYLATALGAQSQNIKYDATTGTVTLGFGNTTIVLNMNNKVMSVLQNGQTATTNMDVTPILKNGRVYLPAKWIAQALKYTISFDSATNTVLINN